MDPPADTKWTPDAELFGRILSDLATPPVKTLAAAKSPPIPLQARQDLLDQVINEVIEALQIGLQATAKRSTGCACGDRW